METSMWSNGFSSLGSLSLSGEPTKFSVTPCQLFSWNLQEVGISETTVTHSDLVETQSGICSYKVDTSIDTQTDMEKERDLHA